MINDGHVHLHYEGQYASKLPAEIMLADMKKVDELKAKYDVDKIAAILLPSHIDLIPEIIKNRQNLKLGLYFNNFRELQAYQGTIESFHFVKLHDDGLYYRTDALQEALNSGLEKGFKRFQFHSQCIGKDQLEVFAKFIKENDVKIYLAHGVFSLYPGFEEKYYRQASAEDVRRLAGNLFLGTTSTDANDYDLYERLEKGVKDGVMNQMCFESDFGFNWRFYDSFYGALVTHARKATGNDSGVMHDNLESFLG